MKEKICKKYMKKAWIDVYKKEWIEEIYKEVYTFQRAIPASYFFDSDLNVAEILMKIYDKGVLNVRYKDGTIKKLLLWGEESEGWIL